MVCRIPFCLNGDYLRQMLLYFRAASIAASLGDKKRSVSIWPEWSDADINAEKWVSFLYLESKVEYS